MRCGARCKRDRHARSRALQKANGHFIPGALADGADHETARVPAVYWSAEYSGGALHRARIVAALCNAQRARGCAVRSTGQRRKPARAQRNLHSAPSYAEARRGGARGGCDCRGDPCRTTPPMNIECGVDEAGRGPLAGPVVAAAVILDETAPIHGLADSKTLSAQKRAALFELICARARAYCIASASVEEIDRLNILNATLLAMRRAVETLAIRPALAQIDGNRCPPLNIRAQAIVRGDAHIPPFRRPRFSPRLPATECCSNCTRSILNMALTGMPATARARTWLPCSATAHACITAVLSHPCARCLSIHILSDI